MRISSKCQWTAYSSQAKFSLLPVSVKKILKVHSTMQTHTQMSTCKTSEIWINCELYQHQFPGHDIVLYIILPLGGTGWRVHKTSIIYLTSHESVSVSKLKIKVKKESFIEIWSYPLVYILSVAALALQWQSGIVVTVAAATIWPTEWQILSIWPFTEKICQPLIYASENCIWNWVPSIDQPVFIKHLLCC